jgi:hypothetical protein
LSKGWKIQSRRCFETVLKHAPIFYLLNQTVDALKSFKSPVTRIPSKIPLPLSTRKLGKNAKIPQSVSPSNLSKIFFVVRSMGIRLSSSLLHHCH